MNKTQTKWILYAYFSPLFDSGLRAKKKHCFYLFLFAPPKKGDGWHFSRFTLFRFICNIQRSSFLSCFLSLSISISLSFTVVHRVFFHNFFFLFQLVNHWFEIGRNCFKIFTLNNSLATSSRHEIYALQTIELHIVVSSLSHVPFVISFIDKYSYSLFSFFSSLFSMRFAKRSKID